MPGDPIRHHVVPAFYLKRFADPDERVMVRRRDQKPFLAKVNRFALVRHFNTITDPDGNPSFAMEAFYKQFEDAAAPILREITATGHIPMHEPRSLLAEYMALQYTRTPEWRDVDNITTEIHAKTLMIAHTDESLRSLLREMHGREPTEKEFAAAIYAREHIDEFEIAASNNGFFKTAITNATDHIMPNLLQEMHWYLVHADDRVFLTSDHPIVFARSAEWPIGILDALEVFFPIDPHHLLVLRSQPLPLSGVLGFKPGAIRMVNQLIAENFYEWIAHHPEQKDALEGLDIPEDPPLMSVNGAMIHGDKRGIEDAFGEMRAMVEGVKRAAVKRSRQV